MGDGHRHPVELAHRRFEFLGNGSFMSSVNISISGKAFGTPNTEQQLKIIAGHEFGHALGLGHTNFAGDAMALSFSPRHARSGGNITLQRANLGN